MAAGDIIITDGKITPEILGKITSEVVRNIQTTAKDPGQYPVAGSLQNLTTLPAFRVSGATYELVRVAISLLKGVDGKEVHIQVSDGYIQWRWTDGEWQDLVPLSDLRGDQGDQVEFRTSSVGVEWKYRPEPDTAYRPLVPYERLRLKFTDLTAEQIATFWREIPADLQVLFQRPAKEAAEEVREQMTRISQEVSQSLAASKTATDTANAAADNANAESSNLEELKVAVTNASYLAEQNAIEAEKQAKEAELQAAEAKKQAAYAKGEADKVSEYNARLIEVEDTKMNDIVLVERRIHPVINGEIVGDGIEIPEGGGGGVIGMQYLLRANNNLDSKSLYASKGQPCYVNFTFTSQQREGPDAPYVDTGERGYCQIFARAGREPYREVKNMYIDSGVEIRLDVAPFLSSGDNNIKINIAGEDTAVNAPALTYSVQLTALSLSANNFQWWQAFQDAILVPLNIGGNINKTLHVDVAGTDYDQSYTVELGTNIYTETSYNYSLIHPGRTGVFNVSSYVSNADGTIRTNAVSFNIICILPGATRKLLAINNRISRAVNWSENKVFDYALYDAGKVSTSAKFTVMKAGAQVYDSENNAITTSAKQTFTLPLEIETVDNTDFDIEVKISDAVSELASMSIPVDNSLGFSANAGAVFYLNPRTRTNSQANRQSIVNEMNDQLISATWKNFNWGADGWMTDADGSKVLRVMAGSSVDIAYKPFAVEPARTGKTIEIDYKVDNVTDFGKESLTIATAAASFVGLKLFPDNLIVHSQSLRNDDFQSLNLRDGQRIRMTLTIMPDAYGNAGFNICAVYINGRKNREFTYENNDYFANASNVIIGSEYADIDLYGIRVYDSALTSTGVLRNYINWLANREDKIQETDKNNVLDANGSEVAYESVKKQFNVFVFNNTFPRLSNPNKFTGKLEFYFANNPDLNKVIPVAEASGQGTSSSKYWWWNIKFKLKNILWAMVPGIPDASVLTAKKNFASSMQSHKMGSVNSFDDLFKAMNLTNEAMDENPEVRVAVYQEPFVGFEKTINDEGVEIYTFMGLYTAGPDKGDKNTFGYDTTKFPGLISIEGSDNAPLPALFRVPWNVPAGKIAYNEDEEAFQYNGVNSFDFDGGKESNISRFIPAYNLVYECSPRLKPFNGTLSELNAQVLTYRNEPYEFWIARSGDANLYVMYYYEASTGLFTASNTGTGNINLRTQLADKGYGLLSADMAGKTPEQLNELFINARVQKFRKEAATRWDINDAIYHRNWVEFHAATDNRAKNTYPYTFGTETSKWKWRGDDFDTIFDIDNQGQAKKGYSVEFHDKYSNGAPVWNGETSNFWNLIDQAFPDEVVAGMRGMMSRMEELGGLGVGDDFDKLFAYFRKYYWSKAQEYFPANLYNADAKFTYETAKLAYIDGRYTNDTDPMTQALGDHYSAEQRWVMKRIVYMMSKYSFGMFSANGTDSISVRAAGNSIKYELTPAMDLYPAIASGTSIIRGQRTKAGETREMIIDLAGSGDQQNTIMGASYLQDIGGWHDKNVTGAMIVQGKRLRQIRLGSKTEPITISISSLTISNCVSLQVLSLSRIATLTGTLNLSACTHLKEVYADGTGLAQLVLPAGGGLEHIEYSAYNRYINLQNFPLLQSSGVIIDNCKTIITDVLISGCDKLNPVDTLATIIEAQKGQAEHALRRIRCVGFDASCPDTVVDMLLGLADGSYAGLDANGVETAGLPVLDGKIHVATIREDKLDELREWFPELVITYDTLELLPSVTLSFSSSIAKPLLVTKLVCSGYFQKIDATTFKVKGLPGTTFTFTFSALNHEDVTGEVTITQQEETKQYSATYIPMRTIKILKRNTTIFIPGATVKIGDDTYTANAAGQVQIRKDVSLAGTVEANDYNDGTFEFEAIVDDTINTVYLDPCAIVTFTVRDDKNNLLSGATVTVGGKSANTNSSGACTIPLKKGAYTYIAKYQNYQGKGDITVGLSDMSVSAFVLLDISTMKPEENGNIQLLLAGTDATLDVTSLNTSYVISWGDGTTDNASGTGTRTYTHTYPDTGYYQVEVLNCEEVTSCNGTPSCTVAYWSIGVSKVAGLTFPSFSKIEYIDDLWKNDTNRTSFSNLCYSCSRLKKIKFDSLINNTVVTGCSNLLYSCRNLTTVDLTPLAGWVSVTDCSSLLSSCYGLTTVDLAPLANWVSVTNCSYLLYGCSGLTTVDLTPLAGWVSVTKCSNLLYRCYGLTTVDLAPLANWVNVTGCFYLLHSCYGLTTVDLTPLANWVSVTECSNLLSSCYGLTTVDLTPLANWVSVTECSSLLSGCYGLTTVDLTPLANWVNVTSCSGLLSGCYRLTTVDLTPLAGWVSVTKCSSLLSSCSGLTTVDLTPLANWVNVTYCFSLLDDCRRLTTVDLTPLAGWVSVTDCSYLLFDCFGLTTVDLTPLVKWTKISSSHSLVGNCNKLTYISILDIPPFTLSSGALTSGGSCPIYVPDGAVETFKTATNWSTYANRIKPISEKPAA